MLAEIDSDIAHGRLFDSPRLNAVGKQKYPTLLKEAAEKHDDTWLANELRNGNNFNATEQRNTKNGIVTAKVPVTAPETLAEGEFNRFYLRGLRLRAINERKSGLIVYRAKQVNDPRPESQAKIGSSIDPNRLLSDLRSNVGIDTFLGLPAGPNSGLSAKLP